MNIAATDFRNNVVVGVEVCYDWSGSGSCAVLTMEAPDGSTTGYRISGLRQFAIFEDFECMHVSQCKLIPDGDGVYLSLDPFQELAGIQDEDNFCFWASTIERRCAGFRE